MTTAQRIAGALVTVALASGLALTSALRVPT